MSAVYGALAPIFLLILLGWVLRTRGILADSFWAPAEKLTYYFMFPALLVTNLAQARLEGLPVAPLVVAQAGGVLIMALTAALVRPLLRRGPFRLDNPAFTSVFQGVTRPNTYVGLAAAAGLWGPEAVTLTAICVAVVVPLVNLLSVFALVHWPAETAPRNWRHLLLALAKNPLIAACLLGIALNVSGLGIPPVADTFLKILGSASLPLGLLAVGAGLDLRGFRMAGPAVALTIPIKLLALPAITAALAMAMGVHGLPLTVCLVYAALPIAANSYVLARQMGGDSVLMARLITASTVVSAVTLPAVVAVAEMLSPLR